MAIIVRVHARVSVCVCNVQQCEFVESSASRGQTAVALPDLAEELRIRKADVFLRNG